MEDFSIRLFVAASCIAAFFSAAFMAVAAWDFSRDIGQRGNMLVSIMTGVAYAAVVVWGIVLLGIVLLW